MDNKRLYEKLMNSIGYEVKKALNEGIREQEWRNILRTMLIHSRTEGYVDEVNGKLTFFDSDPRINDVGAFFVTIHDVEDIINGEYIG